MKSNLIHTCVILLLFVPLLLSARTYYVRNDGNDSNCGFSENDAWLTLANALRSVPSGSVIDLEGEFSEKALALPSAKNIIIDGRDKSKTVFTGFINKYSIDQSFFIIGPGDNITLRNITVRNYGGSGLKTNGGAISMTGRDAVLNCINVDFVDNSAAQGGAVGMLGGSAFFSHCRFVGNYAHEGQGGAIYALTTTKEGGISLEIKQSFIGYNCSLREGSAIRAGCGAISTIPTRILIENSTIAYNVNGINTNESGNFASIFLDGNATYPTVNHRLVNNTIIYNSRNSANTAQGSYTTGVYINNNNNVTLINNIICLNQNCDIQQRTTQNYKILMGFNNIIGITKPRTSVTNQVLLADLSTSSGNNIENVNSAEIMGIVEYPVRIKNTDVFPLLEKSIAINRGLAGHLSVPVDQTDHLRDGQIDIGAFEYRDITNIKTITNNSNNLRFKLTTDYIYFFDHTPKKVFVINELGQSEIIQFDVTTEICIKTLSTGMYLLLVSKDNQLLKSKFVINKPFER